MTIGKRIREIRLKKGYSQEELSGRLGVSRQVVSKWELDNSTPDSTNLRNITEVLNVSSNYILFGDGGIVQKKLKKVNRLRSLGIVSLILGLFLSISTYIFLIPIFFQVGGLNGEYLAVTTGAKVLLVLGPMLQVIGYYLYYNNMEDDLKRRKILYSSIWTVIPCIISFISIVIFNQVGMRFLGEKTSEMISRGVPSVFVMSGRTTIYSRDFADLNMKRKMIVGGFTLLICFIITMIIRNRGKGRVANGDV